jgi:hypothetical protein
MSPDKSHTVLVNSWEPEPSEPKPYRVKAPAPQKL